MHSETNPNQLAAISEVQMKIRCAIQDAVKAGTARGTILAALQRECKYWEALDGEG